MPPMQRPEVIAEEAQIFSQVEKRERGREAGAGFGFSLGVLCCRGREGKGLSAIVNIRACYQPMQEAKFLKLGHNRLS